MEFPGSEGSASDLDLSELDLSELDSDEDKPETRSTVVFDEPASGVSVQVRPPRRIVMGAAGPELSDFFMLKIGEGSRKLFKIVEINFHELP